MTFPTLSATIDGVSVTSALRSATWSLGIPDILSDLGPGSASMTFVGQVTAAVNDAVVISSSAGTQWSGFVDTISDTRDVNGDHWTTITATDVIGVLGAAALDQSTGLAGTLEYIAETMAATAGVTLDVVDATVDGLSSLGDYDAYDAGATYSGSVLGYVNMAAKTENAVLCLVPDGTVKAVARRPLARCGNGTFEVNTTDWTGYLTGSIARSTAEFHSGAACARITSSATLHSGASYTMGGARLIAGQTYRLGVWVKTISGSGDWLIRIKDATTSETASSATFTPDGTWTHYTVDLTAAALCDNVDLFVIHEDASVAVMAIDDVTLTPVPSFVATGVNAPVTWTESTSLEVDINRWVLRYGDGTLTYADSDAADIAAYGERMWEVSHMLADVGAYNQWVTLGGSQRPVVSAAEFVVSADTQTELMLMEPLQWITEDGKDWQVLSVSHSVSPYDWRVTITADDLLAQITAAAP